MAITITNHLAACCLSEMASCFINDLAVIFGQPSQMASSFTSCFTSCFISSPISSYIRYQKVDLLAAFGL